LVLCGIDLGIPAAWIVARLSFNLVSGLLFELKSADPLTLLVAVFLLIMTAGIARYLPARRASRIDPLKALRFE